MTRLQIEADAYRRTAAVSAATAQRAAASVREAFQRRRALEQLRDRAWRRHQREVARADQRAMNELASLRFLAQAAKAGGIHGDD
jgi:flagellar export protein FliJ